MLYSKQITVPKNTSKNNYQTDTITLTKGKVKRIVVFFPWGCAGLCGVQIIRRTWQVFPLSRGEWLTGNDRSFDFESEIDLTSEPYDLVVHSYNDDDTFEHKPIVSVEMIKGTIPELFRQFMKEIGS